MAVVLVVVVVPAAGEAVVVDAATTGAFSPAVDCVVLVAGTGMRVEEAATGLDTDVMLVVMEGAVLDRV